MKLVLKRCAVMGATLTATTLTSLGAYVMDQIGPPFAIQLPPTPNVEMGQNPAFSTFAYDDFMVAFAGGVNFVEVHTWATGLTASSSWPQTVPWVVTIVTDLGGTPMGSVIYSFVVPGASVVTVHNNYSLNWGSGVVNAIVRVPLPSPALAPGAYWVSCTPRDSSGGWYGLGDSVWTPGFPHNGNAFLNNPGNGYGLGVWVPMAKNWPYRVDM